MSGFAPTEEQLAIVEACSQGKNVIIEAGAGAGKTSTLKLIADAMPRKKMFYGAFNRAIADEAKRKFPRHVVAKTIHGLAFGQVGKLYAKRLNGPRQPGRQVAHLLGIRQPARIGEAELSPATIARLAAETVDRFCNSADTEIGWRHVPQVTGLDMATDPELSAAVKRLVLPHAEKIWADVQRTDQQGGGKFAFTHNHYRKLYALTRPRLPYDVVLLDEAQDTSPVVADLLLSQTHAQIIVVGDAAQAIYGFNGGSLDTIRHWDGADARLRLSQSFRFGQEIADEGNKWLAELDRVDECAMRITGTGHSTVGELDQADAVLTRTNGAAAEEVMAAQQAGTPVALVGGGDHIRRLAEACEDLRAGRPTSHPELVAFRTWGEIQEFVDHEAAGSDLRAFVKLIDNHGADVVIDAMDGLVPENRARLTVSTAHRAKGREWDRVRIGSDFEEPTDKDGAEVDPAAEEIRLAYVAVTRAKKHLDPGGLSWIDGRIEQPAAAGAVS